MSLSLLPLPPASLHVCALFVTHPQSRQKHSLTALFLSLSSHEKKKKRKVHKGRVSCACSPKLLRIPWIGVCRCRRETGQTKCKAMFKHRPPPLLLEIKASRWISVHFRVPTEGVSGVCSHWKAVGWKCTYCLIYHSPVYIC